MSSINSISENFRYVPEVESLTEELIENVVKLTGQWVIDHLPAGETCNPADIENMIREELELE